MLEIKSKYSKKKIVLWAIALAVALIFLTMIIYLYQNRIIYKQPYLNKNLNNDEVSNTKTSRITNFDLIIPKLGISSPIIPNVEGSNEKEYLNSLTRGVAHYRGTSLPGSGSNIFIFGHSSSPESVKGEYDKIFSTINNLNIDDEIIVNFNNKSFTYLVSVKKIIEPEETSVLNPSKTEQITLMTCWPIGNNTERLVIVARYKQN